MASMPGMMPGGMDMGGGGGGMNMDLTIKAQCHIGKLLFSAWDIQNCGQYYVSLVVIVVVCFLRHLLTMHKTRLILRLPEELENEAQPPRRSSSSVLKGVCCNYGSTASSSSTSTSSSSSTDDERRKLVRIEEGGQGQGDRLHTHIHTHAPPGAAPRLGSGSLGGSCGTTTTTNNNNNTKTLQRQHSEEAFAKLGHPIPFRARLLLTAYFMLINGSSLLVMLLAMSFNLGILLAIVVGEAAGHLFFAGDYLHNLVDAGSFH